MYAVVDAAAFPLVGRRVEHDVEADLHHFKGGALQQRYLVLDDDRPAGDQLRVTFGSSRTLFPLTAYLPEILQAFGKTDDVLDHICREVHQMRQKSENEASFFSFALFYCF